MPLCRSWFYTHPTLATPISLTHEEMKKGRNIVNISRGNVARRQISFSFYNSKGSSLEEEKKADISGLVKSYWSTTYRRSYCPPYPPICPTKETIDDNIDPLFNRRPVNVFYMSPLAPNKFMDDHFAQPSEARKRSDFFRQIRNVSYLNQMH